MVAAVNASGASGSHAPDCNCHVCQPYSEWLDQPTGASREEILLRTVRAVNLNAAGWHADDAGKARALDVIAVWTAEALAGRLHPAVEAITNAN